MKRFFSAWRVLPAVVFLCAMPALAQMPWKEPGKEKGLMQWLITIGIFVLLLIPGFMNSKRTHQD